MDGKYLATNLEPLKSIGDRKLFEEIIEFMTSRENRAPKLIAYSIQGIDENIVTVDCLFERHHKEINLKTLYFRTFEYFRVTEDIYDVSKRSIEYGIGFSEYHLDSFVDLRNFYLESKN
ncbi:hypothetical protein [Bacillus marasmi]|uniref:hypothetical protein n=1 Tax=Bacillus marasmi TaxID=1926279 RepID=UPI0011C877DD|nr:hypothetical protein [Bacillus marasmi]